MVCKQKALNFSLMETKKKGSFQVPKIYGKHYQLSNGLSSAVPQTVGKYSGLKQGVFV